MSTVGLQGLGAGAREVGVATQKNRRALMRTIFLAHLIITLKGTMRLMNKQGFVLFRTDFCSYT